MNTASRISLAGLLGCAACSSASAAEWYEKIKLGADFRIRHEYIDQETSATASTENHRSRIRARVKATGKVSDTTKFTLGLATGSTSDPVSTNQTLGQSNNKFDINLDLAYIESRMGLVKVNAGKMNNPLYRPGGSDLIWDGDLSPEGLLAGVNEDRFFANAGGLWVVEAGDSAAWVAQGGFKFYPGKSKLSLGASYIDYANTEGHKPFVDSSKGFGNDLTTVDTYTAVTSYTTATGGGKTTSYTKGSSSIYKYDFNLFNVMLDWSFDVAQRPLVFYGDYVDNSGADKDNTGWLAGFKYGKAEKARKAWEFGINYRELEKNAVVGAFSDSDFGGGGTNGRGFKTAFGAMLTDKFLGNITWFSNTKNIATGQTELDYQRWQFDLSCKI